MHLIVRESSIVGWLLIAGDVGYQLTEGGGQKADGLRSAKPEGILAGLMMDGMAGEGSNDGQEKRAGETHGEGLSLLISRLTAWVTVIYIPRDFLHSDRVYFDRL